MRILILAQYYVPEPIPKPVELAEELTRRGHSVSVVTGFPHYPIGKLYPGFHLSLVQRETINDVPVVRSFEYPYHGKSALGRIVNYCSFMISAPLGSLFAAPCDVIYVRHPPLTIGVAAWIIARLRRVPFVYDVQDIWPESAVLAGILRDGRLVRVMSMLERFVYRHADHLLVVTDGARQNVIAKGAEAAKVSVLPNWVDESLFKETDRSAASEVRAHYGWGDRFVVVFAGNIGLVQGLDTVIEAARQLHDEENVLMVLVGDGTDKERLQTSAESLGLKNNLQFIARQPMKKMPALLAAADVLLVHLKESPLADFVIPTKTLAYFAAGKPVLMATGGAAAELVEAANAGVTASPENPAALVTAIRSLSITSRAELAAMGQRGRDYLLKNLSKKKVIDQYEALLRNMIR